MTAENHIEEETQPKGDSAVSVVRSKSGTLKRLVALALIAIVVIAGWLWRENRLGQAEQTARTALEDIGALIVMDANRKHPASLDFGALQPGRLGEAIEHASSLRYLKIFDLTNQPVTESHAKQIAKLGRLTSLHVSGTQLNDESVRHLSRLRRLETFLLADTKVTDAGVGHLGKIPSLVCVDLSGNSIQGDLAGLAGLAKLQWLVARNWTPSPEALETLGSVQNLRRLTVDPKRITKEQEAQLMQLKPQLSIE